MRTMAMIGTMLLAACGSAGANGVALSGRQETRTLNGGSFDRIALEGPDRVVVRVGGRASVQAAGDAAVLDQLEVRNEDGELQIGRKRSDRSSVNGDRDRALVTVTVPTLRGASVSGSGGMAVDRVSGDGFAAAVAGSGELRVDEVRARQLRASVSGSGDLLLGRVAARSAELAMAGSGGLSLAGSADSVAASIAGSGRIDAGRLAGRTGKVSIAGSGHAAIRARDAAEVAILGSGNAVVHGTANCRTSKMGSGSARCGVA